MPVSPEASSETSAFKQPQSEAVPAMRADKAVANASARCSPLTHHIRKNIYVKANVLATNSPTAARTVC